VVFLRDVTLAHPDFSKLNLGSRIGIGPTTSLPAPVSPDASSVCAVATDGQTHVASTLDAMGNSGLTPIASVLPSLHDFESDPIGTAKNFLAGVDPFWKTIAAGLIVGYLFGRRR
jgi:hypothetical protein